jgi:uncharacterized protein YeeX (DUF496 family)
MKRSKKTGKEMREVLSSAKAKEYLSQIEATEFKLTDYFLLGADSPEEIKGIIQFFSEEYLVLLKDSDIVEVYSVNPEVRKPNRIRDNRVRVRAIQNFAEKIKQRLYGESVSYILGLDHFEIIIKKNKFTYEITCSYTLDVLNIFVLDELNNTSYSAKEVHDISKNVNDIFRKQRYYYKKGKSIL